MLSVSRVSGFARMSAALLAGLYVFLFPVRPACAQPVTFESLLREIIDRDAITKFPVRSYTTNQFSSYDRASTSADKPETWFANNDAGQFLRIDENAKAPGGKEYVLMDAKGPGAIVRFWSANPPDNSTLRFYIDGSETPTLDVPFQGFLNGKWKIAEPLSSLKARGFNSYVPIPYATSLKVTMCLAAPSDKTPGVYYQINCRNYAAGTAVESFKADSIDKAKSAIDEVQAAFAEPRLPFLNPTDPVTKEALIVQPGETKSLALPKGPAAVRYMAMGVAIPGDSNSERTQVFQSLVISAEFDGEKTIWCPLGAFFGGGVGDNKFQDWYRNILVQKYLHCRWVMPYKDSGSFSITNTGKKAYTVQFNVVTKAYTSWDPNLMHFHTAWNYEYPIHTKKGAGVKDWNYVEIEGKGIYVADTLSVMNPVGDWWGEGDEKIYVDGEKFPSHFGTGTEDYYGYAWCSNELFEHPFHGQSRCDGKELGNNNYGYTTVSRSRSLDVIPFTKSFKFDMEVWHWKEADVAYGATTYFYAMPGAKVNIKPQPENSGKDVLVPPPPPAPKRVDGAIECDKVRVASKAEGVTTTAQGGFGPEMWTGGTQLWVQAKKVGDFIELEVPVPADLKGKPVKVTLHATKSWDYGIVRFSVGGAQLGKDVDFFNDKAHDAAATGPIELGTIQPTGDTFTLRCEVVGANAKSEGTKSFFGLDCLVLKKAE